MNLKSFLYITLAFIITLMGCAKDNYDPPGSVLKGRVVFNGQPVQVRTPTVSANGNNTTGGVQLELWQYGYQLFTKIPVYINQDGTFSASLFDGNYKLVRLGGAPWENNTDSIDIQLNGTKEIDVPVTPFFTVTDASYTFNKADSSITGTFTVNNVVAGRTLEIASISVSPTQFVDAVNQVANEDKAVAVGSQVSIKVSIRPANYPGNPNKQKRELLGQLLHKQYAFVRIGAKTQGVVERNYSTVHKIELK
jgi:hypothetical protein